MHVKKGDKVKVISGKDRGKQGTILEAFPKKERVLVEGVNMIKKHAKPSQENPQGGILNQEAPIHVSNVMPIDPKTGEPTRVGYEIKNGKKVRITKKCGKQGNILEAFPKKERVLVEGVNMIKKHAKPSQENPQGGILNQEAPIHVSNVMPIDPKTGEPTRVGYEIKNGKKVRIAKKSGAALDK